jgi:hypothetical protein
MKKELKRI